MKAAGWKLQLIAGNWQIPALCHIRMHKAVVKTPTFELKKRNWRGEGQQGQWKGESQAF